MGQNPEPQASSKNVEKVGNSSLKAPIGLDPWPIAMWIFHSKQMFCIKPALYHPQEQSNKAEEYKKAQMSTMKCR